MRKRKDSRNDDLAKRVDQAVLSVRNGDCANAAQAAKKFDVPPSTLYDRLKGVPKRSEAHSHRQLLSPAQEQVVLDWAIFLGCLGKPLNKESITVKAQEVSGKILGRAWYQSFCDRHKDKLVFKKGSGLDPKRAQGFNFTVVNDYFNMLKSIIEQYNIPWENVYNMDEKGLQIGGGRCGSGRKYFFASDQKIRYKIKSDNLELVTVIETICADGTATMQPTFIVSPGDIGQWWDIEGVGSVAVSENGWTNDVLCTKWFTEFVNYAKSRNKSGAPIILILDGHGSHITDEMKEYAFNNNVFLFCLPPKTTHRLQPLDVGVFSPIQAAWSRRCEDRAMEGNPVTRSTVIPEYMEARKEGMKQKTIEEAWAKSGHCPLDPTIFTDEDFAPSKVTSTQTHVPSSYPDDVPTSPIEAQFTSDIEADGDYVDAESDESDDDDDGFADLEVEIVESGLVEGHHGLGYSNSETLPEVWSEEPARNSDYSDLSDTTPSSPTTSQPANPSLDCSSGIHVDGSQPSKKPRLKLEDDVVRPNHHRQTRTSLAASTQMVSGSDTQIALSSMTHAALLDHIQYLNAQLEAANAHCTVMKRENTSLRLEIQELKAPKPKAVNLFKGETHGFLTRPEAKEKFLLLKEKKKEKEDLEKQKRDEKIAETKEREYQRRLLTTSDTHMFEGSLASYRTRKKEELLDLAACLKLHDVDEKTKKEDIFTCISTHLASNPHLAKEKRFERLFVSRSSLKRPIADVEGVATSSQ